MYEGRYGLSCHSIAVKEQCWSITLLLFYSLCHAHWAVTLEHLELPSCTWDLGRLAGKLNCGIFIFNISEPLYALHSSRLSTSDTINLAYINNISLGGNKSKSGQRNLEESEADVQR